MLWSTWPSLFSSCLWYKGAQYISADRFVAVAFSLDREFEGCRYGCLAWEPTEPMSLEMNPETIPLHWERQSASLSKEGCNKEQNYFPKMSQEPTMWKKNPTCPMGCKGGELELIDWSYTKMDFYLKERNMQLLIPDNEGQRAPPVFTPNLPLTPPRALWRAQT